MVKSRGCRAKRPVLILNYDSTEVVPGGAGNAASNVAALGGAARLAGVVGRDETGRRLIGTPPPQARRRARRAAADGVSHADEDAYSRRRYPLGQAAGRPHRPRVAARRPTTGTRAAFESRVLRSLRGSDALLISDYGSGLVSPALVARARKALPRRSRADRRRLALQPAALSRHDRLHAERVGSRVGARRSGSATIPACSSAPGARF